MADIFVKEFTYNSYQNTSTIFVEVYGDGVLITTKEYGLTNYTTVSATQDTKFFVENMGILGVNNTDFYKKGNPDLNNKPSPPPQDPPKVEPPPPPVEVKPSPPTTPPLTITPPPNTKAPDPQSTKTQGTVYRVVTTEIKPNIETDEISLPGEQNDKKQKLEDRASIEYPLIRINDYILAKSEILSMEIDCTGFLPRILLQAAFFNQTFMSREMPKDGDVISVTIRNKSDAIKIIKADFVITSVMSVASNTNVKAMTQVTFFGELFIPGLKSQKNDFSTVGTSMDALMEFCKQSGLGFSTNEDDTDDKQIWLKANISGDLYANNVTNRAYRDSESFYACWIDLYYNFNFVNLNKQLLSAETEVDIAALLHNLDTNYTQGVKSDQEDTITMPKVFTNFISFRTTPFYIKSWKPVNMSSVITFQIGTKMTCEMFEHNKNVYDQPDASKYWAIPIEPTYDKDKISNSILLRGRATFHSDPKGKDLERANYTYTDLYEKYPWLGIQYTISNPGDDNLQWDGNHHKNYQRARVQNLINNKELDKLNLEIDINGTNFNIMRADKMPVALIRKDPIDTKQIDPKNEAQTAVDLFYSGWFLVKGFTVRWNTENKDSVMSNFSQTFILTRREWPTPIAVEPIKSTT